MHLSLRENQKLCKQLKRKRGRHAWWSGAWGASVILRHDSSSVYAPLCFTSAHLFLTCDDYRAFPRSSGSLLRCSFVLLTYLCTVLAAALKSLLDSPHADLGCWFLQPTDSIPKAQRQFLQAKLRPRDYIHITHTTYLYPSSLDQHHRAHTFYQCIRNNAQYTVDPVLSSIGSQLVHRN